MMDRPATHRWHLRLAAVAGLALVPCLHAQFPKSVVDSAAADRGAKTYAADCSRCHGDDGRGTQNGPDLLRSAAVLHDRRENLAGKELATLLSTLPGHTFKYREGQVADLAQFLTQAINKILRSGYDSQPTKLLSGDADAGRAYFKGAGGCSKCHSATGDFAGLGKRYAPAALQQKFLFPGSGFTASRKTQVAVAIAGGSTYQGDLVRIDDFTITLRQPSGELRSFNRTPNVHVSTTDPYAAHIDLLGRYSDSDIHNLTKYLVTLQ